MPDHPGELVVHDELPVVERDARLDHPRAVDEVGTCQRRQQRGQGLLVTGLSVEELGVALQPSDIAGQPVLTSEKGDRRADHAALRRADGGSGETQVHGRGGAAVEHRSALARELGECDPRQDLGVVDDQGAGEGDRRRPARQGHREDQAGNARLRGRDDRLGALLGELQGAHRADADHHDRPPAQRVTPADDSGRDVEDRLGLPS